MCVRPVLLGRVGSAPIPERLVAGALHRVLLPPGHPQHGQGRRDVLRVLGGVLDLRRVGLPRMARISARVVSVVLPAPLTPATSQNSGRATYLERARLTGRACRGTR